MPDDNTKPFVDYFIQNIDKINKIPEDFQIKGTLFEPDFDNKNYPIVLEACKRLDLISTGILNEYKKLITDMIIDDSHNAGIQNGLKAESRFNHDIEGRIPDFLSKLAIEYKESSPEDLAYEFLRKFVFWTDCYCCAKRYPMHIHLNFKTIYALPVNGMDECPYPNGIFDQKYSFTVKSGKLIIANDFRKLFGKSDFERWAYDKTGQHQTVNTGYGLTLYTQYYMEKGLIYISTGNSCPSLQISSDKNSLAIACGKLKGYEKVDSVCTDLWAVQALDYDHFVELCGDSDINEMIEDFGAFLVEVKNGQYEIIDHNKYPSKKEYNHFATFNLIK